jgi:hypothetical protein
MQTVKKFDDLRNRHRNDAAGDVSRMSFIGRHLMVMSETPEGAESAEILRNDIAELFGTERGLRVLTLFEKSVLYHSVEDGSDERALRESNAVRNFILEIRRIYAHGSRS